MPRVYLVHWAPEEAEEEVAKLREAGCTVACDAPQGAPGLRPLQADPPDAIIIDLTRLPSQGRDIGVALRGYRATRHVPLVFVGGEPKKVAKVKKTLPDATFATWGRVLGALKRALARRPEEPVRPEHQLAGYSGTPLPKKLGIKPGFVVGLVGAPVNFDRTLGELPAGATFEDDPRSACDLIIWFTKSRKELEKRVDRLAALAGKGGLWIAWRKQASGAATDVTQALVREVGMDSGLVDYKICAIDETWSGLRFARKKS